MTTLEGYASFSPALDKNGNSVYIDDLGEIYNTSNNRGILKNTVNYPLAQLANFNEIINEQNYNSPLYRDKALLGLSTMTAPLGAGEFLTNKLASKLIPYTGKKIAERTAQGLGSGLVGGSVHGLGRGVIENKNPFFTMLEDGSQSAITGGVLGLASGNLSKSLIDKKLKNFDVKGRRDKYQLKQLGKHYYQDYMQQQKVKTPIGSVYLESEGRSEDWNHNPLAMKNYPYLIEDLKNSEYLGPENPIHNHEKITLFHRLKGKNNEYYIGETPKGKLIYYKTLNNNKNVPAGKLAEANATGTNNIITDNARNFNPSLFERIIQLFNRNK